MASDPNLNQLLNQARVKLPGASDNAIKAELYDVFRVFFNDSSSWMEDITVAIVPDTTEYDILPNGGQIIRLAGVVDENNIPQPAIMPTFATPGATLKFRAPYTEAQTFTATVIKNVAMPVNADMIPQLPDWVLPVWGVGILDGVLGRMMVQIAKSYTNPKIGEFHLRSFRDAVSRARVSTLRRNAFGTQAWRFPQDFSTGNQRVSNAGTDRSF